MARTSPSQPINQVQIARRLKLSTPTVSRALRGVRGINPRTRERVLSLAAELGYEPPAPVPARPAEGRFLCLLTRSHPQGRQPTRFHEGMSQAASAQGASLILHQVAEDAVDAIVEADHQPAVMRNGAVDGIILQYRWPDAVVHRLAARWPCVAINHATPGVAHDLVTFDDHAGMMMLAHHLHGLGHRRIGYFGLSGELTWSVRRYSFLVEACLRLRLGIPPAITVATSLLEAFPGDWGPAVAQACARKDLTAWICPSGYAADRLHGAFLAAGLQVPRQRSIVVYDAHDATAADFTALVPPTHAIGMMAVERLLARIARPPLPVATMAVASGFHAGSTTGPVPGRVAR